MCSFPGPLLWYMTWSYWWMLFSSVLMRRIQWLRIQSGFFWLCIFWRFCWSCMCLSPECSSPNTVFGTGENMPWEQVYNIIMSSMCFWHFVFTHQRFWIPSTDLSTDSLRYILTGVHVESEIHTLHSTIYSWVWSSFFSEADGLKKQKKSTVQIKTNSVIQVCLLNTQKPYVDIYKLTCTVFVCYVKCLIS